MDPQTARGLAKAGALLVCFSLLLPWHVLRAGTSPLGGQTLESSAGWDGLGVVAVAVVALAAAAVAQPVSRLHPAAPIGAAVAISLVVAARWISPPRADELLAGEAPTDPVGQAFALAIADALQFEYVPAWGLYVAAAGALATLAGTVFAAARS